MKESNERAHSIREARHIRIEAIAQTNDSLEVSCKACAATGISYINYFQLAPFMYWGVFNIPEHFYVGNVSDSYIDTQVHTYTTLRNWNRVNLTKNRTIRN